MCQIWHVWPQRVEKRYRKKMKNLKKRYGPSGKKVKKYKMSDEVQHLE